MNDCSLYPTGQCTWYVCTTWPHPVGPVWGDAQAWLSSAQAAGYQTSTTPQEGAVAVWEAGVGGASPAGHVALVTALEPLTVTGEDWPEGAGPITYVVGSPGAPGTPSGYILPPAEEEGMTLDVARSIVYGILVAAYGHAPGSQAQVDAYAGPMAQPGANPEDKLNDLAHDIAADPASLVNRLDALTPKPQ